MSDKALLGVTTANSLQLPLDKLPATGLPGVLTILAQFKPDRFAGKDRIGDITPRKFIARARFSRMPPEEGDMRGDFAANEGSSYFLLTPGKTRIDVSVGNIFISLNPNTRGELGAAECTLTSKSCDEARWLFHDALTRFFDHAAYLASAPFYIALITVRDLTNEVQKIYCISPARSVVISDHSVVLSEQLAPVYALYREAKSATSPYYRLLCLYKIMEGLLGSLRTAIQKTARERKVDLSTSKLRVPDHPDIPARLRQYIGTPVKKFFDNFLQKEYRDAVAHFDLNAKVVLNVSSINNYSRFLEAAFVAELCVRLLIEQTEQSLATLQNA